MSVRTADGWIRVAAVGTLWMCVLVVVGVSVSLEGIWVPADNFARLGFGGRLIAALPLVGNLLLVCAALGYRVWRGALSRERSNRLRVRDFALVWVFAIALLAVSVVASAGFGG
jgi:hypothetical protein